MEGWLPIFFLLVVLKIPVFGALWLVWWASKVPPGDDDDEDSDGGGFNRKLRPIRPYGPRRGPHESNARALPLPRLPRAADRRPLEPSSRR